ncbi:hypothetical protein [Chitinophaga nivalis]|uniref:Transposase n=1 Tax=Chitinophaga nivalis TaxID=2991709 RepID=A0ABT3IND8_9BACT|nr:hypothetical protein [Chitinophaga nivalis]MCW3464823.1 hypothetical protein [Chitinophaga nivalis]MCW3485486.1 hypothetical protein [Chitinophaga nivalis]
MKRKLRKITVANNVYVYTIKEVYAVTTDTTTLIVRIFSDGHKATPLILHFLTYCDPIQGHPLYTGIDIFNQRTQETVRFIIHRPVYIRALITEGIRRGWTGRNLTGIQDGVAYLNELGFDTAFLVSPLQGK